MAIKRDSGTIAPNNGRHPGGIAARRIHPPGRERCMRAKQLATRSQQACSRLDARQTTRCRHPRDPRLVFHGDTITNVSLVVLFANLVYYGIQQRRHHRTGCPIDEHLQRTNAGRVPRGCNTGDKAMVAERDPAGLEARNRGSFPIAKALANGTTGLGIAPHVRETLGNTGKIWPCKGISMHRDPTILVLALGRRQTAWQNWRSY